MSMWYHRSRRISRAITKDYDDEASDSSIRGDNLKPLYDCNGHMSLSRAQKAASIR